MSYLLSIVIPTRNRQKYAIQSILQIYDVTDKRVQIVVQDNSDDCNLKDMISSKNLDDRVKYTYISKRIPGVENYAGGIEQSDGEYICCIGDDDGVLGRITDVVEWAKGKNISVIKPGVQASYIWPETSKEFPTGCLNLEYSDATSFFVNPQDELVRFLKTGCIDLPNALLVKAYHGIVKRDLFQKIYNKTGKYCGGLSPDIYLSVALSSFTTTLFCINFPLTIFGACKQSTTGDSINRVNVGKLEQAPHFIGQPYTWSDKVPRYYCGSNIWADSALHALMDMEKHNLQNSFSIEALTCDCLLNHPKYKKEIMENFHRNNGERKLLRKEMQGSYPSHIKKCVKDVVKKMKAVAKVYRIIRDYRQEKANEKVFVRQGVTDISMAEKMISNVVDTFIDEFVAG